MSYASLHPQFVKYESDGLGRDTYISFNNGGFWRSNVYNIKYKQSYPYFKQTNYRSLGHMAAPFTYYSDGSGRDSYILKNNGGLVRTFVPQSNFHLKDILRTPGSCILDFKKNPQRDGIRAKTVFVSEKEHAINRRLRSIENGIKKRLYTDAMKKKERNAMQNENEKDTLLKTYAKGHFFGGRFNTEKYSVDNKQVFFRTGRKKVKLCLDEWLPPSYRERYNNINNNDDGDDK